MPVDGKVKTPPDCVMDEPINPGLSVSTCSQFAVIYAELVLKTFVVVLHISACVIPLAGNELKLLSPLKKVVASLVPVAVSLASETVLSDGVIVPVNCVAAILLLVKVCVPVVVTTVEGKVVVAFDASKVTPVGIVIVSPEVPNSKLVPDCGSILSTSNLLII